MAPHGLSRVRSLQLTAMATFLVFVILQCGDTLTTLAAAERRVLDAGLVRPGDILIFVGSLPQMEPGRTTMLQVQIAGSLTGGEGQP